MLTLTKNQEKSVVRKVALENKMLAEAPEDKQADPFATYQKLAARLAQLGEQRQVVIRDRAGLSEDAPAGAFDALTSELLRLEGEISAVKARLAPAALAAGRHLRAQLVAEQAELRARQRAAVQRQIEALAAFVPVLEEAEREILATASRERSALALAERLAPALTPPEPAPGYTGPLPATLRRLWHMEEPQQLEVEPGILAVQTATIPAGGDALWTPGVRLSPLQGTIQRLKARASELNQALAQLDKAR